MSLKSQLQKTGRFPAVVMRIQPLSGVRTTVTLSDFISYSWDSSLLIPVDNFSFTFARPGDTRPVSAYFQEGDIAQIFANDVQIGTGIIDQIEIEVDADMGEKVTVSGRDLMAQLEDQDAISMDSIPIYGSNMTLNAVFQQLKIGTRIQSLRTQDGPTLPYLFATEPGESKLAALTRYMEPLNILSWMDPDGTLVIGRPNMAQDVIGAFVVDKLNRDSNVLSMKCVFASSGIPNAIVPVWIGQEGVVHRVSKEQVLYNAAQGPARLRSVGLQLAKTVIVSNPQGDSAQDLSSVNRIKVASGNLLQAYGKRELARQNIKELTVQVTVPGHFDASGNPFRQDTVFRIKNDRAGIDEKMYCYQVQYSLDLGTSQKTNLFFCRLGTIVSDVKAT